MHDGRNGFSDLQPVGRFAMLRTMPRCCKATAVPGRHGSAQPTSNRSSAWLRSARTRCPPDHASSPDCRTREVGRKIRSFQRRASQRCSGSGTRVRKGFDQRQFPAGDQSAETVRSHPAGRTVAACAGAGRPKQHPRVLHRWPCVVIGSTKCGPPPAQSVGVHRMLPGVAVAVEPQFGILVILSVSRPAAYQINSFVAGLFPSRPASAGSSGAPTANRAV